MKSIRYGLAVSVALITFLVYLPALKNDFVEWDDSQYVFENTRIFSLNAAFLRWAFTSFHAGNWHPLTWISHALDYAVWGLNPLGHHLSNNVLHSVNTFIVVLLVVRLWESGPKCSNGLNGLNKGFIAAATTGLLFGLHPVHVESVAWVSERKDLLCAMFYLLSIISYLHDKTFKTYFFFILALLSKPMAVSLPAVLLVLDFYPLERVRSFPSLRTALVKKIPFIGLGVGSSLLTLSAQHAGGTMAFMETVPAPARMLVAVKALSAYLVNIILPLNLVPYYPYPEQVSLLSPEYISAALLITAISAGVYAFKKRKLLPAIWVYYVVTLFPVLGLVQVGSQAMADRYTYLPGIGPFLAAGAGAAWLCMKFSGLETRGLFLKLFGAGAALLLLLALSYLTVRQTGIWRNSETLWSYVIEREPVRCFFAYNNRGLAFSRSGELDRAVADLRKAVTLKPGYADAHANLGIVYYKQGRLKEAVDEYMTAIRLNPGFAAARKNLASALYTGGHYAEALEHYRVVAELRPDDAGALADLGSAYGAVGAFDKAIEHFREALRLDPDHAEAHYNLAVAYSATGRADEARGHYDAARRARPGK
ncbi:MAG: tetratricopeptide repeat protein [Nitrospirae bacterium]|nr:tetratricopeptide repeat protein [Nitrospirota bacterium]